MGLFGGRASAAVNAASLLLLVCLATVGVSQIEALRVPEKTISISSQVIKTNFVFTTNSALTSDGIDISVRLIGADVPTITTEDVLRVNGGVITVQPTGGSAVTGEAGRTVRFASNMVAAGLFLAALFFRPNLSGAFAVVVCFVALAHYANALSSFTPGWELEVTIASPSNYILDSLTLNALSGTITGSNLLAKSLQVQMCANTNPTNKENTINLSTAYLQGAVSICASGDVSLPQLRLSATSTIDIKSTRGLVEATLLNSFIGSYNLSATNGIATSGLTGCTPTSNSYAFKAGTCGIGAESINFVGFTAATVSAASATPVAPVTVLRWSDPQTWTSGTVPQVGEAVVIPAGKTILIDTTTPELGAVEVTGTLTADPNTDFWLSAESITVTGAIKIGTPTRPYTAQGRITLTGAKGTYTPRAAPLKGFENDGVSRGLRAMPGASLEMFANPPATVRTRLNANAAQGDTILTVDSTEGWKVGDKIVISPTTLVTTSQSDLRTITAINGQQVTIDSGLSFARWGRMQYVTDAGLSYTPGTFETKRAHPGIADFLDERAVIIHLTRNLVIEGKNDTHWTNGHGAHVMWMGINTVIQLNGVEVRRAGQAGALGRYPIHSHMVSYNMPQGFDAPSDGTFLGDAVDVYVRNCAVHQSVQRAYTIHGTCGARYHYNVAYDIQGHAYFLEDGSEIRNEIIGNTVLNVRSPATANLLLNTDVLGYSGVGSSGFWFSNGDNTFRDNIAGDIRQGPGLWNTFARKPVPVVGTITKPSGVTISPSFDRYATVTETWTLTAQDASTWTVVGSVSGAHTNAATNVAYSNGIISFTIGGTVSAGNVITVPVTQNYAGGCFGLSRRVPLHPFYTPTVDYSNNTAFACMGPGALTDFMVVDEVANTESAQVMAFTDHLPGPDWNSPKQIPHLFDRMVLWMNKEGAYRNRINRPRYARWIVADNFGTDLRGATSAGNVEQALMIGFSLNDLDPAVATSLRHAFATYHHSVAFENITLINYPSAVKSYVNWPYGLLEMPGAAESWDYYTSPVEMGTRKNTGWRMINVAPFERTPPPHIETDYPGSAGGPDSTAPGVPQRRYWTLAGALYDNEGILAGVHGDFLIFDHPFLDYELSSRRLVAAGSKTVATPDRFAGADVWCTDTMKNRYQYTEPITFVRLTPTYQEQGIWQIKDGSISSFLGWMRHAAFHIGGRFRIYNQDNTTPNKVQYAIGVSYANAPTDSFIVGIPWDGTVAPTVHMGSVIDYTTLKAGSYEISIGKAVVLTEVGSRTELEANSRTFWRDTATNQVWVHYRGGFVKHEAPIAQDQAITIAVTPAPAP